MALIGNPDINEWQEAAQECHGEDLADLAIQVNATEVPPASELVPAIDAIVNMRLAEKQIHEQHATVYFETVHGSDQTAR
jgi:hypothetical protein